MRSNEVARLLVNAKADQNLPEMTADSSLESRLSLKVKLQASVLCQDQNGLSVTDMAILEASAETWYQDCRRD